MILLFSVVFGKMLNFHIFFVLQVVIIFLIFKYNEIKKIIFSLLLTFIYIGIYEIDYWIIEEQFFHISLSDSEIMLINNILFISLLITILIFVTFFMVYLQKSEDQLINLNEELKEKTSNLIQTEKSSALGELTAGISHELNQPLNVINIVTQAILRDIEKDRFVTDNLQNDMCEINIQVQRMSEIISHMKIFTRSSVGYPKERLNINIIIDGVLNFFREQFKENKIEIYVELGREIAYILGDSLRLEQLFINLITNARDAVEKSTKGLKIIKIKTEEVNEKKNDFVLIQVYDNGDGIEEQLTNKIFQPFFTTKDPGKGTGLGLAVVNKIVEDHDGFIEFNSKEKQGTTFNIYLPVENNLR